MQVKNQLKFKILKLKLVWMVIISAALRQARGLLARPNLLFILSNG